jgi:prepilin-type N-terminal cleavage/methylation domain-containing protein
MRTDERGETLLEVIVAVAIMGIVLVAFTGALLTVMFMSDVHRKQASAGAYLRNWAEAIDTSVASGNYPGCADPSAYESVAVPAFPPSGYTKNVVDSRCDAFGSEVQQLTLEVSSTDQRASERLVIFVRKPCPATPC